MDEAARFRFGDIDRDAEPFRKAHFLTVGTTLYRVDHRDAVPVWSSREPILAAQADERGLVLATRTELVRLAPR